MRITPRLRGLDVEALSRMGRLRPDGCDPRPGSVDELARRLSTPASVAAAVARLDRDALLVAQSVVILGNGADVGRLRDFVRGPDEALDAALTRLRDRALVWPGGRDGSLRLTVALGRHWSHPLDLGPPTRTLLDSMTKDPIRSVARRLGVTLGSTRDDAIHYICRALSDPSFVVAVAAKASPEAKALLEELIWRPTQLRASRGEWEANRYRPAADRDAAEQLYDLGLLLAGSSWSPGTVPREVALALRGPQWGPVLTGGPPVAAVPVDISGAGTVALGALESMRRLLDAAGREPLATLKTGGLGQREVQRIARQLGAAPETARLWIEVAVRAGLLGPGKDGRYLPMERCAQWRAQEAEGFPIGMVSGDWRSSASTASGTTSSRSVSIRRLVAASCGAVEGRASISAILPLGDCTGGLTAARPSVALRASASFCTFGRSALPFGVRATIWKVPLKPGPKPLASRS